MSPRRLAAGRANAAKARAARMARLALGPRPPTAKQLAANRANLAKARAVLQQRPVPYVLTPKRRAALLRNIARANAALREIGYKRTRKRLAASRTNLIKANRVPKIPGFKHGLFSASLRETLWRAGETREEFEEHFQLFERAFLRNSKLENRNLPADGRVSNFDSRFSKDHLEDTELIRSIADVAWRRRRAFRGYAQWEAKTLERVLKRVSKSHPLAAGETYGLALDVLLCFMDSSILRYTTKLNNRLERLFRILFRRRFGGEPRFKFLAPENRTGSWATMQEHGISNPLLPAKRAIEGHARSESRNSTSDRPGPDFRVSNFQFRISTFDHSLSLFERAFPRNSETENRSSPTDCGISNFEFRVSEPAPGDAPKPERRNAAKLLRSVAKTAWERLNVPRTYDDWERQFLNRILETAAALNSREPLTADQTQQVIIGVLAVFSADALAVRRMHELEHRLHAALGALLTHHFGPRPEFEFFTRPLASSDFGLPPLIKSPWEILTAGVRSQEFGFRMRGMLRCAPHNN